MRSPDINRAGKQILRNGGHLADAASDEAAEWIVAAITLGRSEWAEQETSRTWTGFLFGVGVGAALAWTIGGFLG